MNRQANKPKYDLKKKLIPLFFFFGKFTDKNNQTSLDLCQRNVITSVASQFFFS